MFVVRPVAPKDFYALVDFAKAARGMTSLPADEKTLDRQIRLSVDSFAKEVTSVDGEYYAFVLENLEDHSLCGISAIRATAGYFHPLFFYAVDETKLNPVVTRDGPSELCSLFVTHTLRKGGLGKLLSLARFHFIKTFPERFKKELMAEMRGYINEEKKSPLWEYLKKDKLDISYEKAEFMIATQNPLVRELIYKEPIMLADLTPEARAAIGKTHPNTVGALKILEKQGFKWTNQVDIIDGGPQVTCPTADCQLIKNTQLAVFSKILPENTIERERYLVSNNQLDFRAIFADVEVDQNGEIGLKASEAAALNMKLGQPVRISKLDE